MAGPPPRAKDWPTCLARGYTSKRTSHFVQMSSFVSCSHCSHSTDSRQKLAVRGSSSIRLSRLQVET
jgi:hypothetical protein